MNPWRRRGGEVSITEGGELKEGIVPFRFPNRPLYLSTSRDIYDKVDDRRFPISQYFTVFQSQQQVFSASAPAIMDSPNAAGPSRTSQQSKSSHAHPHKKPAASAGDGIPGVSKLKSQIRQTTRLLAKVSCCLSS